MILIPVRAWVEFMTQIILGYFMEQSWNTVRCQIMRKYLSFIYNVPHQDALVARQGFNVKFGLDRTDPWSPAGPS